MEMEVERGGKEGTMGGWLFLPPLSISSLYLLSVLVSGVSGLGA
jgi:hypothetical protein